MSDSQVSRTTTDAGIPAASDEHSLTVGANGPILLQDHYVIQKMAQFNRERVPERVVHAKGGGAHGFFEVTEDVTQYQGGLPQARQEDADVHSLLDCGGRARQRRHRP
jgi:catalase